MYTHTICSSLGISVHCMPMPQGLARILQELRVSILRSWMFWISTTSRRSVGWLSLFPQMAVGQVGIPKKWLPAIELLLVSREMLKYIVGFIRLFQQLFHFIPVTFRITDVQVPGSRAAEGQNGLHWKFYDLVVRIPKNHWVSIPKSSRRSNLWI